MSDRPTKKRALIPSGNPDASFEPTHGINSSSVLGINLVDSSIYKAELDHVISLRQLDARRAKHEKQRMEKLVKFCQDELEQTKQMLEEERLQGDRHLEQMRSTRDEAVKKLRELQQSSLDKLESQDNEQQDLWQRKCSLLQSNLDAKDQELDRLRLELRELQTHMNHSLQEKESVEPSTPSKAPSVEGQSSPAPESLMRELTRIRVELAESDRKTRQKQRSTEELQQKVKQLLPEREAARSQQIRNQQLESQLQKMQKSYQIARLENDQWTSFEKSLFAHFPGDHTRKNGSPPEFTTIVRHIGEYKQKVLELQQANSALEQRAEKIKDMKRPAEARMKAYDDKEASWKAERSLLQEQLKSTQLELETTKHQERIWKREIESLKQMIEMLDNLPLAKSSGPGPFVDAKFKTVELELNSTKEELQVVKTDRVRFLAERSQAMKEKEEKQNEHDRVKEKYGRLREALEVEKGKVQEAQNRAIRAENLAAKGAFNPDETRILHLSKNPLSETLQQQNINLKRKLKEALQTKGGDFKATPTPQVDVNPTKLHKRLKQSFKEQIGLFREGVHLITGFRIDMLPNMERHSFRVRSMYAEREEDQLVFQWPDNLPEGEMPTTLHVMKTELALALQESDSYQYMTKFNSLPAFLADVQLRQFEKQTVMTG